jgi:ComF family protein
VHEAGELTEGRFVWPPRPAEGVNGAPPTASPSPEIQSPARSRVGAARRFLAAALQVLHDAERVWLDVRCPVLRERFDAFGWRADSPRDYCGLCGRSRARPGEQAPGCDTCEGSRPGWSRLVRLGRYEPPLSRVVHEVKFTRWHRLGRDLGDVLGEAVAAEVAAARARDPAFPRDVLVIPVPTTFRRRVWRGIDHSAVLAREVARRTGGRLVRPVRREHGRSQLHVLPSERIMNVASAIHARTGWSERLSGRLVILVDDVTTTGATLRATARAVRAAARGGELGDGGEGVRRPPVVWVAVAAVTEVGAEQKEGGKTG